MTIIDLLASKRIAVELANTSPKSEEPAIFREYSEDGLSKQCGAIKWAVDPLNDFHPCYFHMRMYSEADYFMISNLETKAREQFCAIFVDFSDKEHFTEIVDELYLTRANYRELRKLAINMIAADLPNLRKAFFPIIDTKPLKAVPDFAVDHFLTTMDRYVPFPSIFKGTKDGLVFQYGFYGLFSMAIDLTPSFQGSDKTGPNPQPNSIDGKDFACIAVAMVNSQIVC